jgi:hypothetical protein
MRSLALLEIYRRRDMERAHYGAEGDDTCGMFILNGVKFKRALKVIASSGEGWDHVSVSLPDRCPTWDEMEQVKRLFFRDDETAMQLHVPPTDHISFHPNCLHLWRPQGAEIPRPPGWMVGPTAQEEVA